MRRPHAPSFKVEVRRASRRPSSRPEFQARDSRANLSTIDPIHEDLVEKDVNADMIDDFPYDSIRAAEESLFGGLSQNSRIPTRDSDAELPTNRPQSRAAVNAEAFFRKPSETPAIVAKPAEPPVQPAAEQAHKPRILRSIHIVDPVMERFEQEKRERQAAREERSSSRIKKHFATPTTKRAYTRRAPSQNVQADLFKPSLAPFEAKPKASTSRSVPRTRPTEQATIPVQATETVPALTTAPYPQTRHRSRTRSSAGYTPRAMLYNNWVGQRIKKDAEQFPETADRALRPDERWKRRLPTALW